MLASSTTASGRKHPGDWQAVIERALAVGSEFRTPFFLTTSLTPQMFEARTESPAATP